jgi:hypothetical protein
MGTPQPTRHGLPHTNRLEAKTMLKDLKPHINQEIRS